MIMKHSRVIYHFFHPTSQAWAAVVFSISSQLLGSDLRCTPSVSMPLDSSLLIEGAKPTTPSPEVQVVQVVVAAEGNLVQRWQSRLDLDVFFCQISIYSNPRHTKHDISQDSFCDLCVGYLQYCSHIRSVNLLRDLFSCLSSMIKNCQQNMFESLNRHTLTLATTFMLSKSFSILFQKSKTTRQKSCCHGFGS